jgi:hypothetical protein
MAWSFASRESGTEPNPRIALAYTAKIEALIGLPLFNPNFSIGGTTRNIKYAEGLDPFDNPVDQ